MSEKPLDIVFGVTKSDLGYVLVGLHDGAVCAVFMGDHVQDLETELARRFAGASLQRSDEASQLAMAEVIGLVASPGNTFNDPIRMVGTPFQRRVWEELRKIPAGETISYKELAVRIEKPTAVRAVAGACGANPMALIIPCHRVIGANGSLTGYRWGTDRKKELLSRE